MTTEALMKLVAERQGCNLCQQESHTSLDPEGVGKHAPYQINVNLGVSATVRITILKWKKL